MDIFFDLKIEAFYFQRGRNFQLIKNWTNMEATRGVTSRFRWNHRRYKKSIPTWKTPIDKLLIAKVDYFKAKRRHFFRIYVKWRFHKIHKNQKINLSQLITCITKIFKDSLKFEFNTSSSSLIRLSNNFISILRIYICSFDIIITTCTTRIQKNYTFPSTFFWEKSCLIFYRTFSTCNENYWPNKVLSPKETQ